MLTKTLSTVTWLSVFTLAFVSHPVWLQKLPKRKAPAQAKVATCCEEVNELKAQVANLSGLLSELSQKQEKDWVSVVMQVMELESTSKRLESRLTDAESKYSEMNNQLDIMQLQAAQTLTQTSAGKGARVCTPIISPDGCQRHRSTASDSLPPRMVLGAPPGVQASYQRLSFLMFCKSAHYLHSPSFKQFHQTGKGLIPPVGPGPYGHGQSHEQVTEVGGVPIFLHTSY